MAPDDPSAMGPPKDRPMNHDGPPMGKWLMMDRSNQPIRSQEGLLNKKLLHILHAIWKYCTFTFLL